MAKLKGTGIAAVNYPTGMNLGGDPSQALIHSTTTGNFVISLSSTDLGQGLKTVIAQIAAETLGIPFENVMIDTADTDTGPHCMGTFASRATHLLIYVLLLGMPIGGWLATAAGGYPVQFFDWNLPGLIGKNEALSERIFQLHGIGGLMLTVLLVLHMGAGLRHWLRKDGITRRMSLP